MEEDDHHRDDYDGADDYDPDDDDYVYSGDLTSADHADRTDIRNGTFSGPSYG